MTSVAAGYCSSFHRYVSSKTDTVAGRIRYLREKLGLKQEELAALAKLPSRVYVTRVEIGAYKLNSADMQRAFARGLGMSDGEIAALVKGRLTAERAYERILERRAGREPGDIQPASIAFVPEGIDLGEVWPELRIVIERDALPEEHRHTIPTLIDLPRKARHTQTDWIAEAAALHQRSTLRIVEPTWRDRLRSVGAAHGFSEDEIAEAERSMAATKGSQGTPDTDEEVLERLRFTRSAVPIPAPSHPSSDEVRAKRKRR